MAIPSSAFSVWEDGARARLQLNGLPMPDTFFFANNVSVAGEIDVDVSWEATGQVEGRGFGDSVPPDDFGAFTGSLADAACRGRAGGRETGFRFRTGTLDSSGFYAELGRERNGVFI